MIGHLGTLYIDIQVRNNLAAGMAAAGKQAQAAGQKMAASTNAAMASSMASVNKQAQTGGQRMAATLGNTFGGIQKKCASIATSFKNVGRAFTMYVTLPIAALGAVGIKEMMQQQKANAQLKAVLKSTGGVANVTRQHVGRLATQLMHLSGVDDEAAKGMQSMLLTFTKIKNVGEGSNAIFDRATRATLDMATAMNQGATPSAEMLKGTAIKLGKALQDPVLGITALKRVGVNFSKEQREMIKNWVDHGETVKAQKYILNELNTEFGKSAEASGKTLPGRLTILKETFKNTMAQMVQASTPALEGIMAKLQKTVDRFNGLSNAQKENIIQWALTAAAIGPVILILGHVVNVLKNIAGAAQAAINGFSGLTAAVGLGPAILIVAAAVAALAAAIYIYKNYTEECNTAIRIWAGYVKGAFMPVVSALKDAWHQVNLAFKEFCDAIGIKAPDLLRVLGMVLIFNAVIPLYAVAAAIVLVVGLIAALIRSAVGLGRILLGVGTAISGLFRFNPALIKQGADQIKAGFKGIGDASVDYYKNMASSFSKMGKGFSDSTINMMREGGKAGKVEAGKQGAEAGNAYGESATKVTEKTKIQRSKELAKELKDITEKDLNDAKVKLKLIADSWAGIQADMKKVDVDSVEAASKLVKLFGTIGSTITKLKEITTAKGGGADTAWMAQLATSIRAFGEQADIIEKSLAARKISPEKIEAFKGVAADIKKIAEVIGDIYSGAYSDLLTPQAGGGKKMETGWMNELRTAIRNFIDNTNLIENSLQTREIDKGKIETFRRITNDIRSISAAIADIYANAYNSLLTPQPNGGGKKMETKWMDELRTAIRNFIQNVNLIENSLQSRDIDPKKITTFLSTVGNLKTIVQRMVDIKNTAEQGFGQKQGGGGGLNTGWIAGIKTIFAELNAWLVTIPNMQKNSMAANADAIIPPTLNPYYQRLSDNVKNILRGLSTWLTFIPGWQSSALLLFSTVIPPTLDPAFKGLCENIRNILRDFSSSWLVNIPRWFHDTLLNTENWMGRAGTELARRLVDAVKEKLGIHSPSDAFRDIGHNMIRGLLQGLNFAQVMQVMDTNFGGFSKFSLDLYNFMTNNMSKGWGWLGEQLGGADKLQELYTALQAMFSVQEMGSGMMGWLFNWINSQVPGEQIMTSGFRPGSTVAGSGRQSLHATGKAMDIAGANLDSVAPLAGKIIGADGWSSGVAKTSFGEALWKTMTGGNHFDHVHLGVTGVSPFLRSIMPAGLDAMGAMAGGGNIQQMIAQAATARGWGGQLGPLMALIQRESGFNPAADNPTSTAYGLFQMLTETNPNPTVQIMNGLNYISGRYGDPNAAWNFWQGHHWYKGGGEVSATLHQGERVLTEQQNRWFTGLAHPLAKLTSAPGTTKMASKVNVQFPSGTTLKIVNLRQGIVEVVDEGISNLVKRTAEIEDWVG